MSKYLHIQTEAYEANMRLQELGLVIFTFGNASAADRSLGVFAIKPSGVAYKDLAPEKMVIVDFDGNTVSGKLRPSSDTRTHAVLYSNWPEVNGVAHTHSTYATSWAQSQRDIPVYGTTHADHTTQVVPCASPMDDELIRGDYEHGTGLQIIQCLEQRQLHYTDTEMILVGCHAPFTWGTTAEKAVYNSGALEAIAKMAYLTEQINNKAAVLKQSIIRKHFERKHGPESYYGQDN